MLTPGNFPDTRPSLLATLREDGASQSAWRDFFGRYAPAIYRVARGRGLRDCDADDVVQQVMCQVAAHIGRFDLETLGTRRFRSWLRTIAENKIIDLYRRTRPAVHDQAVLEAQAAEGPDPEAAWERQWRMLDLLECIDRVAADVSPRRMQAFRMYSLEGRSVSEVCEALDMTPSSIYVTRCQVLNLIRERLAELEDERSSEQPSSEPGGSE